MDNELEKEAREWLVSQNWFPFTDADTDEVSTAMYKSVADFPSTYSAKAEEANRLLEIAAEALSLAGTRCDAVDHPKKYQHGEFNDCPVTALIEKARAALAEALSQIQGENDGK